MKDYNNYEQKYFSSYLSFRDCHLNDLLRLLEYYEAGSNLFKSHLIWKEEFKMKKTFFLWICKLVSLKSKQEKKSFFTLN